MSKSSVEDIAFKNFEEISLYFASGEKTMISEEQKEILQRWQSAYAILRQFPEKYTASRKLMCAYPGLSRSQAYIDIENAMKFFHKHVAIDRSFVEDFFLNKIIQLIANPNADEQAQAKNVATLQKYIAQLPPVRLDPKHIEQNNVFITVKNVRFSEEEILRLPVTVRQKFLNAISDEITDVQAEEIMNS